MPCRPWLPAVIRRRSDLSRCSADGDADDTDDETPLIEVTYEDFGGSRDSTAASKAQKSTEELSARASLPSETKTPKSGTRVRACAVAAHGPADDKPARRVFLLTSVDKRKAETIISRLGASVATSGHLTPECTHLIAGGEPSRGEKFLAACASGRWVLRMDYLEACLAAGAHDRRHTATAIAR